MNKLIVFIILFFISTLFGQIVILGSSTAEGVGASNYQYSWVGRLQNSRIANKFKIYNLSKGGYTTYHFLPKNYNTKYPNLIDTSRNIDKALTLNPQIIIISLPSNDVAKGYSLDETLNNYKVYDSICKTNKIRLYLTTTMPRRLDISKKLLLKTQRDTLLKLYEPYVFNFYDPIVDSNLEIQKIYDVGDGIHLNDNGHNILFQEVYDNPYFNYDLSTISGIITPEKDYNIKINLYPNPFNSATVISYKIPEASKIEITIYDLLGNIIDKIHKTEYSPGLYNFLWQPNNLSTGVYLISFKAESLTRSNIYFTKTLKSIYLK